MKKNLARALAVLLAVSLMPGVAFADKGRNEGRHEGKHEGKAQPGSNSPFTNIPVSGTSVDGNTFKGFMDIAGFVSDEFGKPKAIGVITGSITDRFGNTTNVFNEVVTMPVTGGSTPTKGISAQQTAACSILNLVLQPLDLNLLGLTVHLDQVALVLNAVPGAGNLLGNLLCAVTGLLDGLALGPAVAQLLNAVSGLLAAL
ncbi:MAG TPA: hypothetical protein VFP65_02065 [Anaeromyxobacteraceae bacterium]|nr:hypothetical protein [Anaeromyxobacteraceae bacterium]